MKLIVISPEAESPCELPVLAELFAAGLTDYHLRKPTWSRGQVAEFLEAVLPICRSRIILHTHHDLADAFELGGLHYREATLPSSGRGFSRAVHDLTTMEQSFYTYNRLLLSPMFPSFSKPGHLPPAGLDRTRLHRLLTGPRFAKVIALGGIDDSRIPECKALGFDGVAVLGAIWQAPDPVAAFRNLNEIATFA